jgi:hypothetical protein
MEYPADVMTRRDAHLALKEPDAWEPAVKISGEDRSPLAQTLAPAREAL